MNNLVAEASEKALKKDDTMINCFVRTGYLLHCTESEADDLIEPQGAKNEIDVPESCVEDNGNAELISTATSVALEEIVLRNIDLDICDETAVSESNNNRRLIGAHNF